MKRITLVIALMTLLVAGAQAQMVGATGGGFSSNSSSSDTRLRGHYLRLEAGFPNFITVAYGYQVTSSIFAGVGMGFGGITYDYYYDSYWSYDHYRELGPGIPIFAEVTYSTPRKNVSFFADFKIGANIPLNDRYYSNYDSSHHYYGYSSRSGRVFYSSLNFGLGLRNFGIYAGISSNSAYLWFSAGVSYNIPLKVY